MNIIYIDGMFVEREKAQLSIFDRSVLFADAVYEVIGVLNGNTLDMDRHIERLFYSLGELEISLPAREYGIVEMVHDLIARNNLDNGTVYLQVSRGQFERDFLIREGLPFLFAFVQSKKIFDPDAVRKGVKLASAEDIRWKRRDIKTTQLISSSLQKSRAVREGKDDAVYIQDGFVTECSASNIFMVDAERRLITTPVSRDILSGITRRRILEIAREKNIVIAEEKFTLDTLKGAIEAFITSASGIALPVKEVDGVAIGKGGAFPTADLLRAAYFSLFS